jgi:hypothetical protein
MGDRGQVKINGVFLYTHYGATDLVDDVKRAIAKNWRWSDKEYLARIIFNEMQNGDYDTETGFGIGTKKHSDIWRLITIKDKKIIVEDYDKKIFDGSFEDFLKFEVPKENGDE